MPDALSTSNKSDVDKAAIIGSKRPLPPPPAPGSSRIKKVQLLQHLRQKLQRRKTHMEDFKNAKATAEGLALLHHCASLEQVRT